MKTRTGFVSNSSSSSFIIFVKNGTTLKAEDILKAFGVNKDSPLFDVADSMAMRLVELAKKTLKLDYIKEYDVQEGDDMWKLLKNTGTLFTGEACDQESSEESTLCDMCLDYEDDKIIIKKEGGY